MKKVLFILLLSTLLLFPVFSADTDEAAETEQIETSKAVANNKYYSRAQDLLNTMEKASNAAQIIGDI